MHPQRENTAALSLHIYVFIYLLLVLGCGCDCMFLIGVLTVRFDCWALDCLFLWSSYYYFSVCICDCL